MGLVETVIFTIIPFPIAALIRLNIIITTTTTTIILPTFNNANTTILPDGHPPTHRIVIAIIIINHYQNIYHRLDIICAHRMTIVTVFTFTVYTIINVTCVFAYFSLLILHVIFIIIIINLRFTWKYIILKLNKYCWNIQYNIDKIISWYGHKILITILLFCQNYFAEIYTIFHYFDCYFCIKQPTISYYPTLYIYISLLPFLSLFSLFLLF